MSRESKKAPYFLDGQQVYIQDGDADNYCDEKGDHNCKYQTSLYYYREHHLINICELHVQIHPGLTMYGAGYDVNKDLLREIRRLRGLLSSAEIIVYAAASMTQSMVFHVREMAEQYAAKRDVPPVQS